MDLLRALRMPFQISSLSFVAVSSLLLSIFFSAASSMGVIGLLVGLFVIWMMLTWLTQFALRLIDDVTNGETETAAASVEMLQPFGDARCWIHPALALAGYIALRVYPDVPQWPIVMAAALLYPASLGAIAMSGYARDALNPVAMMRVVAGLGPWYLLAAAFTIISGLTMIWIAASDWWWLAIIGSLELLLLLIYALLGGLLYMRRGELGFAPRKSPERQIEQAIAERSIERQRVIDEVFTAVRVRDSQRALVRWQHWLQNTPQALLREDVQTLLQSCATWHEHRSTAPFLRGVTSQLLELKQHSLAWSATETGLSLTPGFHLEPPAHAATMIRHAMQIGRRKLAGTLLQNCLQAAALTGRDPDPELAELQQQLS